MKLLLESDLEIWDRISRTSFPGEPQNTSFRSALDQAALHFPILQGSLAGDFAESPIEIR